MRGVLPGGDVLRDDQPAHIHFHRLLHAELCLYREIVDTHSHCKLKRSELSSLWQELGSTCTCVCSLPTPSACLRSRSPWNKRSEKKSTMIASGRRSSKQDIKGSVKQIYWPCDIWGVTTQVLLISSDQLMRDRNATSVTKWSRWGWSTAILANNVWLGWTITVSSLTTALAFITTSTLFSWCSTSPWGRSTTSSCSPSSRLTLNSM